jgi:Holliday junction resolvase RusA-like endonuclease
MLDAFNGVLWLDDSQIVSIAAYKEYSDGEPCMRFTISEIMSAEENGHKKTTIKGKGVKQ